MKTTRSWKAFAGLVLHALLAGIMILSASGKRLGSFPPPDAVARLGLSGWITVIGAGELAAAILLLIPRTSSRSSCRRGKFTGTFHSPAGVIKGNRAKLDVPVADFWYVENGKIKEFNCYVNVMLEQMVIQPDFASAVRAKRP